MSTNVVALPGVETPRGPEPDSDVVEFVQGVLKRALAGETVAVAFVEVSPRGSVSVGHVAAEHYHGLNSGAARLANLLASVPAEYTTNSAE